MINSKKYIPENTTWFEEEKRKVSQEYINKKKIAIIDCDGVITDSRSWYDHNGKALKVYGAYDKEMMNFLGKDFNWEFIFVSDDKAGLDITKSRINHLIKNSSYSIKFFNYNCSERLKLIKDYLKENYIVLFIGDSLSDIPSLSLATYAGCPKNSAKNVKEYCNYVSDLNGADGALADILWNIHCWDALELELK